MASNKDLLDQFAHRQKDAAAWVDGARIHNALLVNHFVDMLDVCGDAQGLQRDTGPAYSYRLRSLTTEFRKQVLGSLTRAIGLSHVVAIQTTGETDGSGAEVQEAHAATRAAIAQQVPMIVNPVLMHEAARVTVRPPLLLRADVAKSVLNISVESGSHYVPVAIKRRAVPVRSTDRGHLKGSALDRVQAELWLWSALLSHELDTEIRQGAIIGLAATRSKPVSAGVMPDADDEDGENAFRFVFDTTVWQAAGVTFGYRCIPAVRAAAALDWRISVVDESNKWLAEARAKHESSDAHVGNTDDVNGAERGVGSIMHALAGSTDSGRQRPNMKVAPMYDYPWSSAKRDIAESINELTMVSGVSNTAVENALYRGLPNNFKDNQVTAAALGVENQLTASILDMCKDGYTGPSVIPASIGHNLWNWRMLRCFDGDGEGEFDAGSERLERFEERLFYVDFELASRDLLHAERASRDGLSERERGLDDVMDMTTPARGSVVTECSVPPLIFLIGCGQMVDGQWRYKSFTASELTVEAEGETIRAWLQHMADTSAGCCEVPAVFVWGPEKDLLRKAMSRMTAAAKADLRNVTQYRIVNMVQVAVRGRVTVKGSLSNSVKKVAEALHALNLLVPLAGCETRIVRHGVTNGLDAMAVVLDAAEGVRGGAFVRLLDAPGIDDVLQYNESDCLDLAQITHYLREHR